MKPTGNKEKAMSSKKGNSKKAGMSAAQKKNAASLKAKAKRDAKKKGAETPLERANKLAGKAVKSVDKAVDKAIDAVKGAAKKPQFFGRKKVTANVDPEVLKEKRRQEHAANMAKPWFAEYRATAIELWVERRKAEAAGDKDAIEKINKKLEAAKRKRDKAKAEDSGKPARAPKAEKPKKSAGKKGGSKKQKPQADTVVAETETTTAPVTNDNAGPQELSELLNNQAE